MLLFPKELSLLLFLLAAPTTYCASCSKTLHARTGSIALPPNTLNCEWRIIARSDERINVNITNLQNQRQLQCAYSYVEIRDGLFSNDPLLGKFCEGDPVQPITSSRRKILIRYVNTRNYGFNNFTASYQAICGGNLYVQGTTNLTYPSNSSFYSNDKRCVWRIMVPEEYTVVITFNFFDIEYHDSCLYDYLNIRDGQTVNSTLLGRYCNSRRPSQVSSSRNNLLLEFASDSTINGKEFSAIIVAKIDECKSGRHNCAQTCVNTIGGVRCTCSTGYELLPNERDCGVILSPTYYQDENNSFDDTTRPQKVPIIFTAVPNKTPSITTPNESEIIPQTEYYTKDQNYEITSTNYYNAVPQEELEEATITSTSSTSDSEGLTRIVSTAPTAGVADGGSAAGIGSAIAAGAAAGNSVLGFIDKFGVGDGGAPAAEEDTEFNSKRRKTSSPTTATTRSTTTTEAGSCSFRLESRLGYEPVVLKNNDILKPSNKSGIIVLYRGETIQLLCPDSSIRVKNFSTPNSALTVTCSNDNYFVLDSEVIAIDQYYFKDFQCTRRPNPQIKDIGICYGNCQVRRILIGLQLSKLNFLSKIELCFDTTWRTTYWTRHELETYDYRPKYQSSDFRNDLFEEDPYLYYRNTPYDRGHLTPNADFFTRIERKMTYYYLNAAPLRKEYNRENWKYLESDIREAAQQSGGKFYVYTGTYLVQDYLYKNNNVLPIPWFFWKVVISSTSKKGVAFIVDTNANLINDKLVNPCSSENLCSEISWLGRKLMSTYRDKSKGKIFCTSIDSLKKRLNINLPPFSEYRGGLLTE